MSQAPANFVHQDNLFDPARARKVRIIGVGSVGSYVALFLTKMGVREIEVQDGDAVSSHNTPASLYRHEDMGLLKVHALATQVKQLTGVKLKTIPDMYAGEPLSHMDVIVCVDSMAARKLVWEQVKMRPTIQLLCDTRVRAWFLDVFAIAPCNPEDVKLYEEAYFTDEKTDRPTCGAHGIVPVSVRAAQVVVSNLAQFWQNGKKKWRHGERVDTLETVY